MCLCTNYYQNKSTPINQIKKMKKLNGNNKLAFNKAAVTELNENSLSNIRGGADSTIIGGETCSGCVCSPILTKITILK